jgi:hypothetical protein
MLYNAKKYDPNNKLYEEGGATIKLPSRNV